MSQEQVGGCHIHPFCFAPSLFVFFVLDRRSRTAPAERDKTGAPPRPRALGGVAPVPSYPCRKAQTPAQGRERTRRRAVR